MIGIFGGTFDPIHIGHLRAALELREGLGLDQVRFIPAAVPPHRGQPVAPAAARLAMVQAAVAGESAFVVDERELVRPGPSYMVDTLSSLRAEFGAVPLCLLLGLDAFLGLPKWHRWEAILDLAHVVVAHRPGWQLSPEHLSDEIKALLERRAVEADGLARASAGKVSHFPITPLAISATAIRERVRAGRSARFLVPDPVWDIILKERLYR